MSDQPRVRRITFEVDVAKFTEATNRPGDAWRETASHFVLLAMFGDKRIVQGTLLHKFGIHVVSHEAKE